MISADNIYKFRSRISKNLYSDMHNTKGNLVEHINIEINEKDVVYHATSFSSL